MLIRPPLPPAVSASTMTFPVIDVTVDVLSNSTSSSTLEIVIEPEFDVMAASCWTPFVAPSPVI